MKAREFVNKFFKMLEEHKKAYEAEKPKENNLIAAWNDPKAFTAVMLEALEGLISVDGLKTEREYFRIDLVAWEDRRGACKRLRGRLVDYCWDLKIAIEHENDPRLWLDEVIKLAHIVCPLRVVIGYLPKGQPHDAYLKEAVKSLNKVEAWKNTKECGDFLLILGDCKKVTVGGRCNYTAYKLTNDGYETSI